MKTCSNCGQVINDGISKCIYCGYPVSEVSNITEPLQVEESDVPATARQPEDAADRINDTGSERIETTCIQCGFLLSAEQDYCPKCGTPKIEQKTRCIKCGTILESDQDFCPKCGTPKSEPKKFCSHCGFEIEKEQSFCPKCGTNSDAKNMFNQTENMIVGFPAKKNKRAIIIIAAVFAAVIITVVGLIIGLSGNKKSFFKLFPEYAGEEWCEISADGSYMAIDTNPDNIDEDDFTYSYYNDVLKPCNEAIDRINSDLGFSEALKGKMNHTTALQGKQSDSNKDYKVTWSYHPDNGLEIIYEFNK